MVRVSVRGEIFRKNTIVARAVLNAFVVLLSIMDATRLDFICCLGFKAQHQPLSLDLATQTAKYR